MNTWIELSEHEQRAVAPALLTEADGAQLHDRYGRSGAVLEVDWPFTMVLPC